MSVPLRSTVEEVVEHLVAAFSNATNHTHPFLHQTFENCFPADIVSAVLDLPIAPLQMTGQRSKNNMVRTFLNPEIQAEYPVCKILAESLDHPRFTTFLSNELSVPLDNSYTIAEIAVEAGVASLVPHRDIGPKRFTCLFFLADDINLRDAGTDLYILKPELAEDVLPMPEAPRSSFKEETVRPPYISNTGYCFVPSKHSWHGFDERPLGGIRKTLILNYVGETNGEVYRNTHWLVNKNQQVRILSDLPD